MLSKLIDFVLAQRVFVLILTVALAAFGIRAFNNLPIEAFPDVQDVQVQIVTQYAGQAPEEVERAVTLPIEREMTGVPHQTQLRSVTISGLSVVTLTFADGTDDYFARQQVLEKLQNVTLPAGLQPGLAPLTTAVGEVFRYIVEAPAGMDPNEVRALQDWVIRPQLRIVTGVADVVSFGGTVKEYQVQVDPAALKRYGVTIDQVNTALTNNSANVGGGLVRRGDEALLVRGIGIFNSLDDIGRVIVSASNGKTVLVSDLGTVTTDYRPRSGIVAFNGENSVVEGTVQMSKGSNAAKVVADVKLAVDALNARLPKGVRLKTIYDRTELINHTVRTVGENLLVGAVLVIAILISLVAVDFGIIIDSAVVLVEALMVRLAMQPHDAASGLSLYGWRKRTLKQTVVELGHPILFAKAIVIVAFIPIYTFQRVEGKIFSPVAFTLSFAMLGAIVLSMTLVPTLLAFVIKRHPMAEKHSHWMARVTQGYRAMLHAAQRRRVAVIVASVALLGVTLACAPLLGSEFLPKLDEGNIWLTISLPNSAALEKTQQIEHQVRAILKSYPEVGNVISQVGRPDDGTDPKGPNNMEILADLNPRASWRFSDKDKLVADISAKIRAIPGVPTNFSQVIEDNVEEALSGVKGEIAVKISGPELDVLTQKSDQVASILNGIAGAADVAAVKIGGQTEIDIVIDRGRIARLGVNVADVNNAIQTALAGSTVNTYYEGDRRFDITLRLQERFRSSVDDIAGLQVTLPNNAGTVALGDVARISVRQGAARISREGSERYSGWK